MKGSLWSPKWKTRGQQLVLMFTNKLRYSMELASSVTQGTELCNLYEETNWTDERAHVLRPIPYECTPVQVHVPLEPSSTSGNVFRGQKVGHTVQRKLRY